MFRSVRVDEESDLVYDKINRRLQHLTSLKTNSRKKESEDMMVIQIYWPIMLQNIHLNLKTIVWECMLDKVYVQNDNF